MQIAKRRAIGLCAALLVVAAGVAGACSSFTAADDAPGTDGGSAEGAAPVDGASADSAPADAGPRPPVDCKTIHAARPDAADGTYVIDPDGLGPVPATKVYCDMTTEGGGWLLVARSVAGSDPNTKFGWASGAGGDPEVDGLPYSLNVGAMHLAFTDVLFGAYSKARTWSPPIYRRTFEATFLIDHVDASTIGPVVNVDGGCNSPSMLKYYGYVESPTWFYFRDTPENGPYGLLPNGWQANVPTPEMCSYDARLGNKQAMIFVR